MDKNYYLQKINNITCDYIVFYTGSREQAEYVSFYSKYLKNNSLLLPLSDSVIKSKVPILGKNFLSYFFLDFPDIIISDRKNYENLPIMGIEILEQKPVGWNHTQRFPRSAASAIRGVPFAYLMPQERYLFDKYKGSFPKKGLYKIGDEFYKENLRKEYQLLYSVYKLTQISQTPILAFFWPIDIKNKFISEGLAYNTNENFKYRQLPPGPKDKNQNFQEIEDFFNFIDLVIEVYKNKKRLSDLMDASVVQRSLEKINPLTTKLYTKKHITLKIPDGGNINIGRKIETTRFIKILKDVFTSDILLENLINTGFFKEFLSKKETVLIEIDSDPLKGNRGFSDPYSGVVASFNYRYCREKRMGMEMKDKDTNLVMYFNNKNASIYWEKIIALELVRDKNSLKWTSRTSPEKTLELTKALSQKDMFQMKKELKNFFYFCDLILTQDNLFLGFSFI